MTESIEDTIRRIVREELMELLRTSVETKHEYMSPEEMSELAQTTLVALTNQRAQLKTWPFHKVKGSRAVWYHRPTIEAMIRDGRVPVRA